MRKHCLKVVVLGKRRWKSCSVCALWQEWENIVWRLLCRAGGGERVVPFASCGSGQDTVLNQKVNLNVFRGWLEAATVASRFIPSQLFMNQERFKWTLIGPDCPSLWCIIRVEWIYPLLTGPAWFAIWREIWVETAGIIAGVLNEIFLSLTSWRGVDGQWYSVLLARQIDGMSGNNTGQLIDLVEMGSWNETIRP